MEKNRSSKILIVVILLLAVLSVSVGFAAFSQNLTIRSKAKVSPNNNMYIYFASQNTKVNGHIVADPVSATPTQYDIVEGVQTEHTAVIDNTYASEQSPKITDLRADFTEPGQSVAYSFYVYNAWEYDAYLKNINIDSTKECTAKDGALSNDATTAAAQQAKIAAACNGISISIAVGDDAAISSTTSNINNHVLAAEGNGNTGFEPVVVTITYAAGSSVADTDFDVTFGDIVLNYSSQN